MRREHNGSGSVPIPFAEDLIFFAPLTEGDTADHIGWNDPHINGVAGINWDDTEGKYCVVGGTSSDYIHYDTQAFNKPFTIYCKVKHVYQTNSWSYYVSASNLNTGNNYPISMGYTGTPSTLSTLIMVVYPSTDPNYPSFVYYYKDGTCVTTVQWSSNPTFNQILLGYYTSSTSLRYYIKDIRVYSRAFEANEIPLLDSAITIDSPTNVTATVSNTTVNLSWSAVSNADYYCIFRSPSGNPGTYEFVSKTPSTSYADTAPSGTSYYKIRAYKNPIVSDFSSAVSITVTPVPSAPTNVSAIYSYYNNNIGITWDSVSYATYYDVYRSVSQSGTYLRIATNISTTSYTDSNPSSGDNYYKIKAVNTAGSSGYSQPAYATTIVLPTIVYYKSAIVNSTSNNSVVLNWAQSIYAESYKIYRSTSADSGYTSIGTSQSRKYIDYSASSYPNTTLYYKISGVNPNGEGELSSYVSIDTSSGIPFADEIIFYAPLTQDDLKDYISFRTGAIRNANTTKTWDSTKGMYLFSTSGPGSGDSYSTMAGGFEFIGITPITNDNFTVFAQIEKNASVGTETTNVVWYGNLSDWWNITPERLNLSVQPVKTSMVQNNSNSPKTSFYSFATVTDTEDWTGGSSTFDKVILMGLGSGVYSASYYIKDVRIYNRALTSSEITTLCSDILPATPTNLFASLNTSMDIDLYWSASTNASSYKIYRASTNAGPFTQIGTSNSNNYNDSSPLTGSNYYRVKASNSAGDSDYSSIAYATTNVTPTVPTHLSGTVNSSFEAVLTWDSSDYAIGYYIYRSTSYNGTYSLIGSTTTLTYTDAVSPAGTYYYKVSAMNASQESALTDYISVNTLIIPSTPTGLTATVGTNYEVILSWTASQHATQYHVYRSTSSSGPYIVVDQTTITSTSYTDYPTSGNYYYKISALNSNGESALSSYVEVSTVVPDIPFSENLVFYAPLTEGDLTDHISGVSPSTDSGCSYQWDSNKGMYLLTAVGSFKAALKYTTMNMGMADRQGVTVVIDVQRVQTSNGYAAAISTPNVRRNQSYNVAHVHEQRNGSYNNDVYRCVCTIPTSPANTTFNLYYYKNGTLVTTLNNYRASVQLSYNEVYICQNHSSSGTTQLYVSNARVYNRYMTAAEVAVL